MYHKLRRSNLSLTNCVFSNNRTTVHEKLGHGFGGGIYVADAKGMMHNCTFEDNVANSGGGALMSYTDNLVLQDCTFIGNQAPAGAGGGIHSYTDNTYSLINCRFVGNSARLGAGGVVNGGESKATLVNCIFVGNSSRHGTGGMYNPPGKYGFSHATLTNCTFVANSSRSQTGGFAGHGKHRSTLSNCILWSNTSPDGSSESAQVFDERTVINYCCIQNWSGKLGGTGNFGLDPLFVDPNGPDGVVGTPDDNLRLAHGSPCINSGHNAVIPADTTDLDSDGDVNEPIPFDLDSQPRILNGTVDIGAYESG